jgi:hypothetical protein
MKQPLSSLRIWIQYITGLRNRADHHGPKVRAIWPCVLGYAIAYADDPGNIRARLGRTDIPANQAWVVIGGRIITFSYNHAQQRIEARKGHTVLATFTNDTKASKLLEFFDSLCAIAEAA